MEYFNQLFDFNGQQSELVELLKLQPDDTELLEDM